MPDFTVIRVGSDTSGRPLYMTRYAWTVWQAVLATPEVQPFAHLIVIVQGAFMARAGGGASASAGYHDLAGCWDIRTWNLTTTQIDTLIRALRKAAIAAWRRDQSYLHGGMDPHIHVTAGWDRPLTGGASASWTGYLRNQNGLASGRPDYEWRPSPLVTMPPAGLFEEDYMTTTAAQQKLDKILAQQDAILAGQQRQADLSEGIASDADKRWAKERERDRNERERQTTRYRALVAGIGGVADRLEGESRELVLSVLREAQDVTGEDNPAPTA